MSLEAIKLQLAALTRASGVLAANVTAPRLPGGKFSSTGVTAKKPRTKYGPLTAQQRAQLQHQLDTMIGQLAAWPSNDPTGYKALHAQATQILRQLTYAKMHSARKPRARKAKRATMPTLLALQDSDLVRYAGQTTVYGAGHRIIGNVGNGAGIKAEASLAAHRANRSAYVAAKGQDAYQSRAKRLQTQANKGAATLTPADRRAMEAKRGELIQIAATAKTAQERRVARIGAILLTRHMGRYDKAAARQQTAKTTKAPSKKSAATAKTKAGRTGSVSKTKHAGNATAHTLHAAHSLLELAKTLIETGTKKA